MLFLHDRWLSLAGVAFMLGGSVVVVRQTPPRPPPPPSRVVADSIFAGIEKFAAHARSETDVDSDRHSHVHEANGGLADPGHLSAVYVFSYDKPGLYNPADVDAYRRKLHNGGWTCRDCAGRLKPGEATDVCTRPVGGLHGSSLETAVIEMRPTQLTFVHTIGSHGSGETTVLSCRED